MPRWLRYVLLQIPGIGLLAAGLAIAHHFAWLSWPWLAAIMGLWILKDAVMYPFVRNALADAQETHLPLPGDLAVVTRDLDPQGYVRIGPELWRAEGPAEDLLTEGTAVRITDREGLTLRVIRATDSQETPLV